MAHSDFVASFNPRMASEKDASEIHTPKFSAFLAIVSGSVTRPNDTAAYISGDLIANSTTAGQVVPIALAAGRAVGSSGLIRRLSLKVNDSAWANATIRVHLYRDSPTLANGDNGAWSTTESNYLGASDILLDRSFTDAVKGIGIPNNGSEWSFEPSAGTRNIFALLESRSAVTPAASKIFTLIAEVHQN